MWDSKKGWKRVVNLETKSLGTESSFGYLEKTYSGTKDESLGMLENNFMEEIL